MSGAGSDYQLWLLFGLRELAARVLGHRGGPSPFAPGLMRVNIGVAIWRVDGVHGDSVRRIGVDS